MTEQRITDSRKENEIPKSLVKPEQIYLSPLHIKVELKKHFMMVMDQNCMGFLYLKNKFVMMSTTKIKEGIFVGLQIRELINYEQFVDQFKRKQLHSNHLKLLLKTFWVIISQKTA